MKLRTLLLAAVAALIGLAAREAAAASATIQINIQPSLAVTVPAGYGNVTQPSTLCNAAAGSPIVRAGTSGGDGNPVSWSLTGGDTTDFVIDSGGLILVAPGGITSNGASCATIPRTGANVALTITATQP